MGIYNLSTIMANSNNSYTYVPIRSLFNPTRMR